MSVNGDTRFCLLQTVSTKDSEVHFKMAFHEPLAARGGSLWMKRAIFTSPRHRFHFFLFILMPVIFVRLKKPAVLR